MKYPKREDIVPISIHRKQNMKDYFRKELVGRRHQMFIEIKSILSNLCISGAAITQKVIIAAGNGVLSASLSKKIG